MNYDIIINAKNKTGKTLGGVAKGLAAITGAATLATGAIGALVLKNAGLIKEMSNQAKVAGVSSSQFQKMAFAAKTVGIEQDKLSDILKDVNDKVGDFMQTGAGPMADFFENIAPKVGLTAEMFKNLSGPDALQLYVKGLEDANLSQADMTFYLEALASDLTGLMPLLKDGGKEFGALAQQAEDMGLILDDVSTRSVVQLSNSFDTFKSLMTSVGNNITAGVAPQLQGVIDYLSDLAVKYMPDIQEFAATMFDGLIWGAAKVVDGVAIMQIGFEKLKIVGKTVAAILVAAFEAVRLKILGAVNTMIDAVNTVSGATAAGTVIPGRAITDKRGRPTGDFYEGEVSDGTGRGGIEYIAPFDVSGDPIAEATARLQELSAEYDILIAQSEVIQNGGGPGTTAYNDIMARTAENLAEAAEVAATIPEATTAAATGVATITTASTAAASGLGTLPPIIEDITDKGEEMGSKFDGVFDGVFNNGVANFDKLKENFFRIMADMVLNAIFSGSEISNALGGAFGGGGGGGLLGSVVSSIFGGAFADGGNLASGKIGLVGEAGPELIKGPATIYSNSDSRDMLGGSSSGGAVFAPVFQTTVNPSKDTSPEEAKQFADQFNKSIEAKVTDTLIKFQNRQTGFQAGRSY